jgi:hypothetical protein
MAAMIIVDDLFDTVHTAEDDDMILVDWSDDWSDSSEDASQASQTLPTPFSSHEILMDFELPSLDLLGYDEHGLMLPGLSLSSASSASSTSDTSMEEGLTGSFFDRFEVTSRKLRESMKKSQETRKSLVFKTEQTAKCADRVEKIVKSSLESTDRLQSLLEKKDEC